MHYYCAYGLGIRSALSLPELTSGVASKTESGEVAIRLGPVGSPPAQLDPAGFGFWAAGDEACHFLEKVGAFLVRGGREIVIDPAPGVEERLLRLSLLGPAFALLLHQRGFLVMHASVVARGDRAVAILGKNGWGKSTIAGALYAKGYDLVADDVAAVQLDAGGCERPSRLPSGEALARSRDAPRRDSRALTAAASELRQAGVACVTRIFSRAAPARACLRPRDGPGPGHRASEAS